MTFVISNNIVEPHVETTSDDTLAEPSVAKPLQECVADDHVTNSCESPRPDQDAFPLSPTSHALDAPHKRPRTQSASPPPSSMEKRPRHVSLPPAPHLAPPLNGFSRLTPEPSPVLPIQTLASTQQATLQSVARPDGGVWQTISNTFMNCLPKASSSDLPPPSPELHATPVDYADDDQLATPKPIVNMCVAEPHTPPSPPPSPGVESEADGPGRCLSALSDHDCEDVSRDVSPNVFTAIDGCEGLSVVQTMTPSPTPGLMPPTLTNERSVPSSVDGFPFHTQMDLPTPTSLTKVNALELSIASSLLTSVRSSSEPPGSTHVTGELSSQKPVLSAFESARMPRASSAQPRVPRKLFVSSLSLTLPHAALPPPLRPPTTPLEDFTPPPMSDLRTVIRSPDPTATSASPPADMSLPIKTVEEHASASPHESAPPSVSAPARLKGGAGYNKKAELRDLQLTAESLLKGSWHEGRRSGTRSSMATSSSPAVETATTVRALDADTANLGENAKKSPSAPPSQSPTRSRLPTPVQPDSVPHLTRSVMAAVAASATSPQSGTKEEPLDPSFSFSSSRIPRKKAKNEVAESVVHAVRQAKKRGSYSTPPKFMKGSVSRRAPSSILSQVANIREESPDPLALGPTSSERGLESPPRKRARPLYKKPKRPDRSYCDEENEIIDSYFPLEDSEGHPTKDAATKCSNALVKAGYQRRSEGALQWRVRTIVWPEKRNAE